MDFGIKEFKRLLAQNPHLTKSQKNKAVKLYKERAYERFNAIREQYEKLYLEGAERVQEEGLADEEKSSEEKLDKQEEV